MKQSLFVRVVSAFYSKFNLNPARNLLPGICTVPASMCSVLVLMDTSAKNPSLPNLLKPTRISKTK